MPIEKLYILTETWDKFTSQYFFTTFEHVEQYKKESVLDNEALPNKKYEYKIVELPFWHRDVQRFTEKFVENNQEYKPNQSNN